MRTVLLLGNGDRSLTASASILRQGGYDVRSEPSAREGLAIARGGAVDAVLTNLQCDDMPVGLLLASLQEMAARLPVVVTGDHRGVRADPDSGGVTCVNPIVAETLVEVLEEALRRSRQPARGWRHDSAFRERWPSARLAVVTSNERLRDTLAETLPAVGNVDVVATTHAAERLPAAALRGDGAADVLLMDIGSSDTMGQVRNLVASCPHLKIILVDVVHVGAELVALLEAGVCGFLLRRAGADDILRTVWAVLGGATVIPQVLACSVFAMLADRARPSAPLEWHDVQQVTRREHQIMVLIADGLSNKEIATKLNIATFTVKSHVHNVLQKLGLSTRTQIARALVVAQSGAGSLPGGHAGPWRATRRMPFSAAEPSFIDRRIGSPHLELARTKPRALNSKGRRVS